MPNGPGSAGGSTKPSVSKTLVTLTSGRYHTPWGWCDVDLEEGELRFHGGFSLRYIPGVSETLF